MARGRRTLLGKRNSLGRVQAVFLTDEALEVDDLEYFHVRRTRLFLDEIQLLTYHQRLGADFVVACGVITLFVAMVTATVGIAAQDWMVAGVLFAAMGLPPLVLGILRLVLKLDVITAYGKSTSARMEFAYRKAHARRLYELLARRALERQERLAGERAPEDHPAATA